MVSEDGKTGLIVAGLTGGESGAQKHARNSAELLPDFNGVTVKPGGEAMSYVADHRPDQEGPAGDGGRSRSR